MSDTSPGHWGHSTEPAGDVDAEVAVLDRSDDEKLLAGSDAASGRFAWHHADCGTIYADTLDEAITHAYDRLSVHDPITAGQKCANVQRAGFNETPSDWKPAA